MIARLTFAALLVLSAAACTDVAPGPASPTQSLVPVSIVLENQRSSPIRVTVELEGRAPGQPDPRSQLKGYPQYLIAAGGSIVVFDGLMVGIDQERQLSFIAYTERCEWLADSPLNDLPFEPIGNVRVVFDSDGRAAAPVAEVGRPGAGLPRPAAQAQCQQ